MKKVIAVTFAYLYFLSVAAIGQYAAPLQNVAVRIDGGNPVALAYSQIQNQGSALPTEPALNCVGLIVCSDDPGNARTKITYSPITRAFTLENPTGAENMTMFYLPAASTITEVRCVVKGTTPSVTYNVVYGTDRSAAGTNVTSAPAACTNTTTGVTATLNNTSPAAGSYVWLTTSAQSGTVTDININVTYTQP